MRIFLLSTALFFLRISDAFAHHPWEGRPLTRWHEGLLSGFAHPVIGFDHLAFLAAVAVLCAVCFGGKRVLAVFVPATVAGVFMHLLLAERLIELPFYETAAGLTVAAAGFFVFSGVPSGGAAFFFVGLFGIVHGYAYGAGIVGAEPSPLVFYLFGLAAAQTAVVFAVAFLASKLADAFSEIRSSPAGGFPKVAGALLFAAGAVMSFRSAAVPF